MIMKISMKIFAAGLALGMMCQTAAAQLPKLNMEQLRKQAEKEYLNPVSPGYEGKHPFWNVYSTKFIYAPAFDFKETEGAAEYLYTVSQGDKVGEIIFKQDGRVISQIDVVQPLWERTAFTTDIHAKTATINPPNIILFLSFSALLRRDLSKSGLDK